MSHHLDLLELVLGGGERKGSSRGASHAAWQTFVSHRSDLCYCRFKYSMVPGVLLNFNTSLMPKNSDLCESEAVVPMSYRG